MASRFAGRVQVESEKVGVNTAFSHVDPASAPFDAEAFEKNVHVKLFKLGKNYIEFDIKGISPAIANALRRVVISEIPTMAIETVFVVNNTSIIPDEILSHRLGLVPIYADPRKFDFHNGEPTDVNTIVFELREKCLAKKSTAENDHEQFKVLSRSLKWVPQGSQEEVFAADPLKPAVDDILLLKLRPRQEVDLELHCVKGLGKDHAKWSPVSCASYRLLPCIDIKAPIVGKDAHKFAKCFPEGVIEVQSRDGQEVAVVLDARKDTVSRECLRHPEFVDKVELSRVADHFIFQLETVGFYGPLDVVREGLKALSEKCVRLRASLQHL